MNSSPSRNGDAETQHSEHGAQAPTEKAGSTPAQWQRSGETGGRFNSGVVDSGEPKARPASGVSASAESNAHSDKHVEAVQQIVAAWDNGLSLEYCVGLLEERFPRSAEGQGEPFGYAVVMDGGDGAFVGCYRNKEIAEQCRARQPGSHRDVVVPVYRGAKCCDRCAALEFDLANARHALQVCRTESAPSATGQITPFVAALAELPVKDIYLMVHDRHKKAVVAWHEKYAMVIKQARDCMATTERTSHGGERG